MKPTLTINSAVLGLLLSGPMALGQANFLFRNIDAGGIIPVDAPVFDAQGLPLWGTNYLAELWGGTDPSSLAPTAVLDEGDRREFARFTFVRAGYFSSPEGFLVVPTVLPRGWAWLQVRAWDARLGATYEEVAVRGLGGYGESTLFYAQGGDPFDQFPVPGRLIGLQSFSLRAVVPEPSTWVLLALGGGAVWWRSRRSR